MGFVVTISVIAGLILVSIECIENDNCADHATDDTNNGGLEYDKIFDPINSYDAVNMWNGLDEDSPWRNDPWDTWE